jgi:hypothetical protein
MCKVISSKLEYRSYIPGWEMISPFSATFRPALEAIQSPVIWGPVCWALLVERRYA